MKANRHQFLVRRSVFYKILQDIIWSLWTIYKEENGADFGDYGISRYNRAVKELESEGDLNEN